MYRFNFLHKQYEKFLGFKVSQSAFRRIRRLLESHSLPITKQNLEVIAKLKIEATNHNLSINLVLQIYLKLLPINAQIPGNQLYLLLKKSTNNRPHRTTIQRWIPQYNPNTLYNTYQVSIATVHALTYNLRSKNNEFRAQRLRSGKISA
jgi:hypothetical protein